MKFSYIVEEKDMAAYMGDYLLTTQEAKRQVLHRTLAPSVTCCAILAIIGAFVRDWGLVLVAAILFPLCFLLGRIVILKSWRRIAAKYGSAHPELLGPHELEITPDALIQRSEGCESRISLNKLHSVADAKTIIVIQFGTTLILIVPKRHLTEEQIAFILNMKGIPNTPL